MVQAFVVFAAAVGVERMSVKAYPFPAAALYDFAA